jgi:hypothetical protein
MAIKSRPGFKTNVEASVRSTAKRSVYFDLKPNSSSKLRFTPTSNEDGQLFFESSQHFKFTSEGEKRAYACLAVHGNERTGTDCPICEYLDAAVEILGGPGNALVKSHGASNRWHAQIVPVIEGDTPVQTFIIGLSKTTAGKVNRILKMEQDNRKPLLTDPDKGQIIQIDRTGSGLNTKYEVLPTNVSLSLDEYFPGWEEKFINVEKELRLRIVEKDELLAAMEETFGDAIFDALKKHINSKATA